MNEDKINEKDIIDLVEIYKTLKAKKKVFFIMWPIVFVLSCIWIFPQPRFYQCEVSLAPETMGEDVGGGLAGIASNFGINLGGANNDAIYPTLYPDLLESNDFVVDLLNIKVKTEDGSVNTDYYTYLNKYQKKNWLTQPLLDVCKNLKKKITNNKNSSTEHSVKNLDPFKLSEKDNSIVEKVRDNVSLSVDRKTDVITILVTDQDRVISACLADSIRQHLQNYIIEYRTKKTRIDVEHYQQLTDSTNLEYRSAVNEYAQFCDANQEIVLQSQISKRDELENEMQMKYNTYQAMKTQLEAMKAKLQERTPAFTTLKTATVPIKPAGPKRVSFVFMVTFIVSLVLIIFVLRKELIKFVYIKSN